jgi:type I restriction enzyme R subunit
MSNKSNEQVFQYDIISQMMANGWQLGTPAGYNRESALYEEDVLGFVPETQDERWQKYCKPYPLNPEKHLLGKVVNQFNKAPKRRTALISAAVTGKIDVRNWQPAQSETPMEASA